MVVEIITALPYPPYQPAYTTSPVIAAYKGSPQGS